MSITLVFVNKTLLSGGSSLNAPLFITWYQCAVSNTKLSIGISKEISSLFHNPFQVTAAACYAAVQFFSGDKTKGQLSPLVLKQVMPLSIVFVLMITFNNLCLKNVGISFYYISRSLTTVFNVVLTYSILGESYSVF